MLQGGGRQLHAGLPTGETACCVLLYEPLWAGGLMDGSVCWPQQGIDLSFGVCLQLAEQYLESIKGVGFYRANSGPNDKPRWEAFGISKE